jgi:hypothetical protein
MAASSSPQIRLQTWRHSSAARRSADHPRRQPPDHSRRTSPDHGLDVADELLLSPNGDGADRCLNAEVTRQAAMVAYVDEPPLRPKHVWSIRTRLQMGGRTRDLAMFNLAIRQQAAGLRCCRTSGRGREAPPSSPAATANALRQRFIGVSVNTAAVTTQRRQRAFLATC